MIGDWAEAIRRFAQSSWPISEQKGILAYPLLTRLEDWDYLGRAVVRKLWANRLRLASKLR